ncbi:hypothetical protein NDA01_27560 [Trichocoleus desertorum AS-A10]|uniref:hypothetical protein n=1 Tax=Trichocoleus desertorum TaxID=1481672 RepID=UPI0032981CF4
MKLKWLAHKWFAALTTTCVVICTMAMLLALYPLDLYRFALAGIFNFPSCWFWVLGHGARSKAKKKQQVLQFYRKSSGDWLTSPEAVEKIVTAIKERPLKEVEDFYRNLQFKMHEFIEHFGMGCLRTGFIEVVEACLQVFHPDLNTVAARQLALKEFESYKQQE